MFVEFRKEHFNFCTVAVSTLKLECLKNWEEKEAQDPSEHLAVDELDKCSQQLAPAEVEDLVTSHA